eukprot:m.165335 g.165335  ORF g.165335 m.165335 type:complete len:71 (+) comp14431_c1_seq2:414-626(+)
MLSRTILEVKDRSGSLTDAIQSKQDDITFTQQRIQTAESQKEAASLVCHGKKSMICGVYNCVHNECKSEV